MVDDGSAAGEGSEAVEVRGRDTRDLRRGLRRRRGVAVDAEPIVTGAAVCGLQPGPPVATEPWVATAERLVTAAVGNSRDVAGRRRRQRRRLATAEKPPVGNGGIAAYW